MRRFLPVLMLAAGALLPAAAQGLLETGPLAHRFGLTLERGERQEMLGPLLAWQKGETNSNSLWTVAPFMSLYREPEIERTELDVLYPLFSYDRFGTEYRWHLAQFLNFHGSLSLDDEAKRRRNLFPFFFSQRSSNPTNDYWSLLPVYGHFRNHLFRDEVRFVAAPLYVWSRKGQVETDNYLFPFFHLRHGGGVSGWQLLPFLGHETKSSSVRTNALTDEPEVLPGHDKWFALFPFFHHEDLGLGTENPEKRRSFILLYSLQRSPERDNTTLLWPFFSYTEDHKEKFKEWGMPFPFIGWARGEGKHADRVWPFWGKATNASMQSDFFLWPLYTHRHVRTPEVERERTRILWFPYSQTVLRSPVTGVERRRRDLWPLFSWNRDFDGKERLQVLAIAEPVIPDNKSIARSWSPLWSLYRAEKDPKTGASSRSLLWNLWRRDETKDTVRTSSFFGVVRTRRTADGTSWRYFWRPFADEPKPSAVPTALASPTTGAHRGDLFGPRPARGVTAGTVAAR
jgi:hypothetical protein